MHNQDFRPKTRHFYHGEFVICVIKSSGDLYIGVVMDDRDSYIDVKPSAIHRTFGVKSLPVRACIPKRDALFYRPEDPEVDLLKAFNDVEAELIRCLNGL